MAVDHFAKFGLAPAPWLDNDALKEKFLASSAEVHPDKAGADKAKADVAFKELNEAYNVLRNSRTRLLHLLEISGANKPGRVESIPAVALDFFAPIAEITRQSDALLKEKAAAQSPMVKVQFFGKALDLVESLQSLQQKVQSRIGEVEAEIRRLNEHWLAEESKGSVLQAVAAAAAALGFLERWNAQLQERAAALTF